jgi:GNAT superfamily N-acetyltransferase
MGAPPTLTDLDVQLIEQAEAECFHRLLARTPEDARIAMGIETTRIGDGIATAMVKDHTGYWTKAMGFEFDVPVDDALVAEVVAFSRDAGKQSGTLAIAPSVLPGDWDRIRAEQRLEAGNAWAKFACPVGDFVRGWTELEIRQLGPAHAQAWAHIAREAMGMPEPDMAPALGAALVDPAARVFGAFDAGLLVGAAAVYCLGEVASFTAAGTLASHRNRGVHSALLTVRATAATEAGCRLLTCETSPSPEGSPSYRNLIRAGFTHLYDRTDWNWTD